MKIASRAVIDEFAAKEYRRHYKMPVGTPSVVGAAEAAGLLDRREFLFHGRPYNVPPIPWPLAVEILDVRDKLAALDGTDLDLTKAVFTRAMLLSKKACRPVGLVRRLLWRITPNPFQKATPWQVGIHLGFFLTCIVTDRTGVVQAVPGTSKQSLSTLSSVTPRGSAKMATR